MSDDTLRTSMMKVVRDPEASMGVRQLALEILQWRIGQQPATIDRDATAGVTLHHPRQRDRAG
jgi:hypothetical protein